MALLGVMQCPVIRPSQANQQLRLSGPTLYKLPFPSPPCLTISGNPNRLRRSLHVVLRQPDGPPDVDPVASRGSDGLCGRRRVPRGHAGHPGAGGAGEGAEGQTGGG